MRILYIDRIRERRLWVKKKFEPNFDIITLSSFREAMAFARAHTFDVLIVSDSMHAVKPESLLKAPQHTGSKWIAAVLLTDHVRPSRVAGSVDKVIDRSL